MSEELSKFFAAIAEEKKKSKAKTKQRSKKSEDFLKQFSEEFEKLKEQEEQHKRDVAAMEAFLTQPSPPKPEPEYLEEDTAEDEGKMIYGGMWEEPEPDPEPELIPETPLQEQALEYLKTKKKEIAEESAEVESIKKQIQDLKKNITSLSLAQQGMGGGGAVNIRDMDDVDRSTALVNGKFLKYNSTTGKFVGADATGESDEAAILDNSGTPELATGITAAEVRTLIGAGTSSFDGAYGSLSGRPTIPAAPALEDNSGTPALATGITAAEVRTAIGAIDDYTVTQSDVTAHQAALSITESQISDLQTYALASSVSNVTNESKATMFTSAALTGTPTAPTANAGTNTTQIATTAFVETATANLVDSAPGTLNTLNELAAALGDDENFSTTVTNNIATKAPLASAALTGTPTAPTASTGTDTTQIATTAFVKQEIDALKALLYAYDQS